MVNMVMAEVNSRNVVVVMHITLFQHDSGVVNTNTLMVVVNTCSYHGVLDTI